MQHSKDWLRQAEQLRLSSTLLTVDDLKAFIKVHYCHIPCIQIILSIFKQLSVLKCVLSLKLIRLGKELCTYSNEMWSCKN